MEKEMNVQQRTPQQRIELYRSLGYDLDKERNFVIDKTEPIEGCILEIGTGKGNFALALAQKGYHFISVDISEEEQLQARTLIKDSGLVDHVDFRIQDAENLDFEDAHFDNVFSVNLMHHLKNPYKVLDEMIRVVKPSGRIINSDFTDKGFEVINKIHNADGREHHKGHATIAVVKDYLMNKGFTVQECAGDLQQVLIATR